MNPSTALATVIVEALAELGVRQVVLCPGSRSAPLAYAVAEAATAGRVRLHVRLDERSAGFVALGLARADPTTPAAVITTSGTAAANLHPAVLEAAHAGVPLLVITADRPHELRATGASQTTDQVKLFGDAVRWFAEIPAPQRGPGLVGAWRNVVARAVAAARGNPGGRPGPVQVNVAFTDPLTPDDPAGPDRPDWPEPLTGPLGTAGLTRLAPSPSPTPVTLPTGPRTVVLAGDGAGPAAAELAVRAGWPLLSEPSSGARTAGAIGPYRLLLARPELGGRIERVVMFGRPTLSRPVTRLLGRADVELVVVSDRLDWADPGRRAALVAGAVAPAENEPSAPDWPAAWSLAAGTAGAVIDRLIDDEAAAGRLTGALIARELAAVTGPGDVLFAGSSNPIRDLDLAAGPLAPTARLLANRGLAGIDGTLSTAAGVALADSTTGRVRCLVGDLTFLHDAGGLLVGSREQRPDLQIVVLDDGGGGIFELLEHGGRAAGDPARREIFERVFGTPQDADPAALCAGYGVRHELVDDVDRLRQVLADPPTGTSVIQVRVERARHRPWSEQLRLAIEAALD